MASSRATGPTRRKSFQEQQADAARARAEAQERNQQALADRAAANVASTMARRLLAGCVLVEDGYARPWNDADAGKLAARIMGGGGPTLIFELAPSAEAAAPGNFGGQGLYTMTADGGPRTPVIIDWDGNMEAPEGATVHRLSEVVQRHERVAAVARGDFQAPAPAERTLRQRADYLVSRLQHALPPDALKTVHEAVTLGQLRYLEDLRVSRHLLPDPAERMPDGKPVTRNAWSLSRWPHPSPLGAAVETRTVANLLQLADSRLDFESEHAADPTLLEAFPLKDLI